MTGRKESLIEQLFGGQRDYLDIEFDSQREVPTEVHQARSGGDHVFGGTICEAGFFARLDGRSLKSKVSSIRNYQPDRTNR